MTLFKNQQHKSMLFAGTAIIAVAAFTLPMTMSAPAYAADELSIDADSSGTFDADELATSAFAWGGNTDGTGAAGEATDARNVRLNASATINALADAQTIGSGTGDAITVDATGYTLILDDSVNDDGAETVTIDGNIDVGSFAALNLTINGNDTDATGDIFNLDINGNVDLGTGAWNIVAGANANNAVNVSVSGDITSSAIVLNEGSSFITLTFDGATAQSVSGTINGDTDADGTLVINNASGVTFSGVIGATQLMNQITIEKGTGNSSAIFQDDVSATAFTLGTDGNAGDINTITFDGSTAGFSVNGAITGTATETNNIVVSGGSTIVQATGTWGAGGEIDDLSVTGSGTKLDSEAAIDATTITIGTGATIDIGAGALTGAVTSTGTLQLTGTGGVVGTVDGAGTLDVDEDATVSGNIGTTTQLTAIDVAATKTLTASGNVDAATTTLNATSTLAMTTGNNLTGNVVATADGDGTITLTDTAATTAIVGNIGTSSASVGALSVAAGANVAAITTTGDLYVDAITLGANDTLTFLGTSTQTVSGTIAGGGAGQGDIIVGDGALSTIATFNGTIGGTTINDVNVTASARGNFNGDVTVAGTLTNGGTLFVDGDNTFTADTLAAGTGTYIFEVENASGTDQSGSLVIGGGGAIDFADDTVQVSVASSSGAIADGTEFLIANGTGDALGVTGTAATIADDSFIYNFTMIDGTAIGTPTNNSEVYAIAELLDVSSNAATKSLGNAATTLLVNLQASSNTEINQLQASLSSASTQEEYDDRLEAATSDTAGGGVIAGLSVGQQTSSVVNDRIAYLRTGDGMTGMAAGEVSPDNNFWVQGFGQQADQDKRDGVSGYEATTYGMAMGLDTKNFGDGWIVGGALSLAQTEVDSDALDNTQTEVDSYQLSLYMNYEMEDNSFISGQFGYISGDNDTDRYNVGGVSGLNASGNFDSQAYLIRGDYGRSYDMGDNSKITPVLSANYMNYSSDGYTETGAGGANLIVKGDDLNMFELGFGVDITSNIEYAEGDSLQPSLHLGVRHDLIGDEIAATNQYAGGGSAFNVEGFDPAQTTLEAGVGFTYFSTSNWDFSADYNFEAKEDYTSNAGMMKASFKF